MVTVSLKEFEGPLDLLLHMISNARIDIRDIFLSQITDQYLDAIANIDELDMDAAASNILKAERALERFGVELQSFAELKTMEANDKTIARIASDIDHPLINQIKEHGKAQENPT